MVAAVSKSGKKLISLFLISKKLVGNGFRRLSMAIKPWQIGITYIVSIFAFAGLFWLIPGEFHHQVAVQDQATKEQASEVTKLVVDHFKENFKNAHNGYDFTTKDGWRIDTSLVSGKSFTADKDSVHLQLDMYFINEADKPIQMRTWGPTISWPILNTGETGVGMDNLDYVGHAKIVGGIHSPIPMNVLFPGTIHPQASQIIFVPPSTTLKKMIDFHYASNGLIGRMYGSYWRMLYLSAVTITTLGYGDIVPITDRARILVGFEAVFGILLAGFFLNSISHKVSEAIRTKKEADQKIAKDFVAWSLLVSPTDFMNYIFSTRIASRDIENGKTLRFGSYFGNNNAFVHNLVERWRPEPVPAQEAGIIRENILPDTNSLVSNLRELGSIVRAAYAPHATYVDPKLISSAMRVTQHCEHLSGVIDSDQFRSYGADDSIPILNNHIIFILSRIDAMQEECERLADEVFDRDEFKAYVEKEKQMESDANEG